MTAIGNRGPRGAAPPGASGRGTRLVFVMLLLLGAFSAPAAGAADNTAAALEAAGWSERSPGLLASLPPRTVEVRDSGIGGEFVLAPGTTLLWERLWKGGSGPGNVLEIEMFSEGMNLSSEDYLENGASFPVSVTAVFGRDSLDLPVKRRILDFFAALYHGFRPGGIRLTYATGHFAPVGSMYRLSDEETVFVLVGDEERGKTIAVRRDLAADFRAAYGRDPRGPVTRLIVRAERPSREKGAIKAGVRVAFPGR